ncbi:MAG: S53 family peptidase [Candidatus Tumulicola sp.]
MSRFVKFAGPLVAVFALAACNAGGGSSSVPGTTGGQSSPQMRSGVPDWQARHLATRACADVRGTGRAQCEVLVQNAGPMSPDVAGWGPADLQARYKLPSSTKGGGVKVAIVDAYDNPNVAKDLAAYRTNFGLGTAKFFKYNQTGQQSNYPSGSTGWGVEIDLDVQMVSAVCPKCTIDLIEANSSNTSDLEAAEAEAVTLGAHIVSNSWICYGSVNCDDPTKFNTPGVMYLAASGDNGYNDNGAPEALASVVSVGGTVLSKSGSKYNESAWNGAGSGCATGITKPAWQHDKSCTSRTDADVSALAWQAAEYDTYGNGGWFTVGGTSVASPIIAGVYGLAGNAANQHAGKKLWNLKNRSLKLNDITTGSNGSCGGSYLCTAGPGYDGPTGWGTPLGIQAF